MNPSRRLKQLQTGCPKLINLVFQAQVDDAAAVEREIHTVLTLHGKHKRGEWFELSDDNVVSIARQLAKHSGNSDCGR